MVVAPDVVAVGNGSAEVVGDGDVVVGAGSVVETEAAVVAGAESEEQAAAVIISATAISNDLTTGIVSLLNPPEG
ncbi:MAG: hypothetical protein OEM22_04085 [Acidimicrobiia bacterium]|nr:hypothetical protein [Acidimicrobiia bacterium]MDH3470329.1 hypothetical protein [Acidimicrobiia bacterium]